MLPDERVVVAVDEPEVAQRAPERGVDAATCSRGATGAKSASNPSASLAASARSTSPSRAISVAGAVTLNISAGCCRTLRSR